ncbi:MAG: tetraacyldisaccharide 4'-kinase [Elusimicrobiales bacterium]|nr:tetraacyldisaccharide 4'-kinase [Elusimicrobiales bacterium]
MHIMHLRDIFKRNIVGKYILYFLSSIYYILFEINKLIKILFRKKKEGKFLFVCVGNISTGGTGKTTIVIELAKKLYEKGIKTSIIMRGYKSKYEKNDIVEVDYSDIESIINDQKISDEQKLMAIMLKKEKIPIIASKNRKLAIDTAITKYKSEIIISDDGYQNFNFEYDYSVVVINPNQINEKLLPFGNLREPYSGLKRANIVIINHCELFKEEEIKKIEKIISKYIYNNKIFRKFYTIDGFEDVIEGRSYSKNFFTGRKIAVMSGIGDNEQFINYLIKIGAKPVKIWKYPDHYQYTEYDLISIENLRENLPLVTTMKDAVRILQKVKRIFKSQFYITKISTQIDDSIIEEIIIKLNENNI